MNSKQRVVLVVEDDTPLRIALVTKLSADGFKVIEAQDGKTGLAEALTNKPDMILLDIVMPLMDGLSMVEALREDAWGKTANVIILSNNSDNAAIAQATGNGVYEYIIKSDKSLKQVSEEVRARLDYLNLV